MTDDVRSTRPSRRAPPDPRASATSSCSTPTPTRCPKILREESPRFFGDADVPIEHYISREWHELEKERLWSRVWQFACREEHIPDVGDHIVYDIAGRSYIVMRSAPDTIKAYPNACLHRGRQLKQYDGNCSEIRCPFHGFAWDLDGSLQDVPAHWDLPHVTDGRASTCPR